MDITSRKLAEEEVRKSEEKFRRIVETAGEGFIIMSEVIDLDVVSRVREYGTLGTSQVWKDLRDYKGKFPMYADDIGKGHIFNSLGPLKLNNKIGD